MKRINLIPTSKLAKKLKIKNTILLEELNRQGYIVKEDEKWALTEKGENAGGVYKNYFGKYIAWPDDFNIELDRVVSKNSSKIVKQIHCCDIDSNFLNILLIIFY